MIWHKIDGLVLHLKIEEDSILAERYGKMSLIPRNNKWEITQVDYRNENSWEF